MDFHHNPKYSKDLSISENEGNFDSNNFDGDQYDFDKQLIDKIKPHPCLYDKKAEKASVDKCEEVWISIAQGLETSVENCQFRWKRLKQYFCKERHRRYLDNNSKVIFKLYEYMLFMDAHIYRRKSAFRKKLTKPQTNKSDNDDNANDADEMFGMLILTELNRLDPKLARRKRKNFLRYLAELDSD